MSRKTKVKAGNIVKDFEYVCRRAYTSLPAFLHIFGLVPQDKEVKPAKFHYEISDILLNSRENFAIEAFRESAKSTLVLLAYPLYALFFPESHRQYIVIIKANQRQATKKLKEIVFAHQTNDLLFFDVEKVVEQSAEAYEVKMRSAATIRIEAYGKGGAIRGLNWKGRRPDIVIIDDPQDLEDAQSPAILEKDWEWFLSEVKFLGKDSRIFLIGNNLGEKCLIERVFEHAEELEFHTLKIPAIDENGNPTWPEMFPLDELLKEKEAARKTGQLDIWYRERLCQAIASENQIFKREYFRFYSPNEKEKIMQECNIFAAVDLAISEKETADYTAVVVVAVNSDNHWFVLDVIYGRFNPSETIEKIFWVVRRYNPQVVGIEKVQYQAALQHFLEKEMRRRNLFFRIEELKAQKQKEIRIKALEPRFKAGLVHFPDIADWLPEMETELLMFPRGKHDDLIDALAYIEQIATPASKSRKTKKQIPRWTAV